MAEATSDLRDKILEAATDLFAERGYGATSVREVVERVGCTKPSLYYYFGSKEGLYLEVLRFHMARFTALIDSATEGTGSLERRLARSIAFLFDYLGSHRSAMRLLYTAEHRPEEGAPAIDLVSLHEEQCQRLADLLQEGIDNGELRSDVDLDHSVAALIGMVNVWILRSMQGAALPDDLPERILELYFNGVAP